MPAARKSSDTEHWKQETLRHVRLLAKKKKGQKISVNDYNLYRRQVSPSIKLPSGKTTNLPSGTTLYRMFGDFPSLLEQAGVAHGEKTTSPRKRQEDMIADLQYVAKQLGVDTLSTHAYDHFRTPEGKDGPVIERPGKDESGKKATISLSSSSVIRKWAPGQRWSGALSMAGLKSSERNTVIKATEIEAKVALQLAKEHCGGRLTPSAYNEYRDSLPEEEREKFPTAMEIMEHFPTWQHALKLADVEQQEAIHPTALYSATDIRRIVRRCETYLRHKLKDPAYQLEEVGYLQIRQDSTRPMPSWDVIVDMMRV